MALEDTVGETVTESETASIASEQPEEPEEDMPVDIRDV
jgi:hypothetical protein